MDSTLLRKQWDMFTGLGSAKPERHKQKQDPEQMPSLPLAS